MTNETDLRLPSWLTHWWGIYVILPLIATGAAISWANILFKASRRAAHISTRLVHMPGDAWSRLRWAKVQPRVQVVGQGQITEEYSGGTMASYIVPIELTVENPTDHQVVLFLRNLSARLMPTSGSAPCALRRQDRDNEPDYHVFEKKGTSRFSILLEGKIESIGSFWMNQRIRLDEPYTIRFDPLQCGSPLITYDRELGGLATPSTRPVPVRPRLLTNKEFEFKSNTDPCNSKETANPSENDSRTIRDRVEFPGQQNVQKKAEGLQHSVVAPLIVAATGGVYYYLSRRYTEAFFEQLGIPASALKFGFADYLFSAARTPAFLLIVLVLLGIANWLAMIPSTSRPGRLGLGQLTLLVPTTVYIVIFAVSAGFVIFVVTQQPRWSRGFTDLMLFLSMMLALSSTMVVLMNQRVRWFLRNLSEHRVTGSILLLFIAGLMAGFLLEGPEAWGRTSATAAGSESGAPRNFKQVLVIGPEPRGPRDLAWRQTENGEYESGPFYLVLDTEAAFWLRPIEDRNRLIVLSRGTVSSLEVFK